MSTLEVLHLRALVEYDGTRYHGFQIQANLPTVQGDLEGVLARLTGKPVRLRYAGRTDAGVHATGQVIAMHVHWRHPVSALERALNALLSADIAVRDLEPVVDPRFHPRFSARSRVYRYSVWTAAWRSPLHCRYALHQPRALDVPAMNEASAHLLGKHDFASFGRPTYGEHTERRVYRATWQWTDRLLLFDIEANAFLQRMVRSIVATLLEVGLGRQPASHVAQVLAARDRAMAAPPAQAHGLCLLAVNY